MPEILLMAVAACIAFFVSMTVGANSVSVSMAPAVGANTVSVLRGAFIVGIFGFFGALLQGQRVAAGIGETVVDGTITFEIALVALFVIGTFIAIGITFEYPTPAAFVSFGSVAGAGLAAGYEPNISYWTFVLAVWVSICFVSVGCGMLLARLVEKALDRLAISDSRINDVILSAGILFAFIGGGSQVGLAIGPLVSPASEIGVGIYPLLAFGGVGILIGAWVKSPVILNAVGRHYASLGPRVSLPVLLTAIPLVQIAANTLGVPLSYNHVLITSIIGCSLVSGKGGLGTKKIAWTGVAWTMTLIGSFGGAYLLYTLFVA